MGSARPTIPLTNTPRQLDSPWPHRLAVLLVCATFPLIWVGSLVTSYDAGMAVPDWPNTYGYNLFLYPIETWIFGPWDIFIEHGHRLMGARVGLLAIAMCWAIWRLDGRSWMRVMGLVTLAAVIAQGVLGGARVIQNEVLLAKIHGCFGPLFFGLCVALAVVTSRRWRECQQPAVHAKAPTLHRLCVLTVFVAYIQLVLGSELRHLVVGTTWRAFQISVVFHLLVAGFLSLQILALAVHTLLRHRDRPALWTPAMLLAAAIVLQIALGCGAWVTNYGWPAALGDYHFAAAYVVEARGLTQAMITTAHVATGSLILGIAVMLLLRAMRFLRSGSRQTGLASSRSMTKSMTGISMTGMMMGLAG